MRILAIAAALLIAASSTGQAAKAAKASHSSSSSSGGDMARMGFGGAYIAGQGGSINALSFDMWVMDDLVVEAVLGAGSGSLNRGGTDVNGRPINDPVTTFGLGGGARYNLASPTENLHFQAVARLTYEMMNGTVSVLGRGNNTSTNLIALYGGAGFEAFFPAWPNVSLEMNVGLNAQFGATTVSPAVGPSYTYGESNFFLGGGNAFLPLNLGIHYYF